MNKGHKGAPTFRVSTPLIIVISFIAAGILALVVYHFRPHSAAEALLHSCQQSTQAAQEYSCYSKYLSNMVAADGAPAALNELDRLQQAPGYVQVHCHTLAHAVGRAAYIKYKDPETALQYEDGLCYTGYTHGVMESYMANYSNTQLDTMISTICHPDADHTETLKYYNCVHGVGHGIMLRFNGDVFKSLPYCDKFTLEWEQSACFNGIFMQNVVVNGDDHVSQDLKTSDPLYPCDAVEQRMMDACYLTQAPHIMQVSKGDAAAAFKWCDKALTQFINSCYQGMGTEINAVTDSAPQAVVAMCSQGDPNYRGYCYGAAAEDDANRRQQPSDADPLCNLTPSRYKQDCEAGKNAFEKLLNG